MMIRRKSGRRCGEENVFSRLNTNSASGAVQEVRSDGLGKGVLGGKGRC